MCLCVAYAHVCKWAVSGDLHYHAPLITILLFPEALSLDLGLRWQPGSPSEPPVSIPNSAGVTGLRDQIDFFRRVLGFVLRPLCLCRQQSYPLIHACPPPEQHVRFKASCMIRTMALVVLPRFRESGTPRESGEVPCTHHGFDAIHPFKGSCTEELVLSCWHFSRRFWKLQGRGLTRRNRKWREGWL